MRVVLAEPELAREAEGIVAEDGGVDADEEISHVPEDDAEVDVGEEADFGVTVEQPEGYGHDDADQECEGDPLIARSDGEHVARDAPGDGQRVVLLNVLPGPDVGAGNRSQNVTLVRHDADHHDVVEDGADDAASHLGCEGRFGGEVSELGELEVTKEELALLDGVEAEDGEIHVCFMEVSRKRGMNE